MYLHCSFFHGPCQLLFASDTADGSSCMVFGDVVFTAERERERKGERERENQFRLTALFTVISKKPFRSQSISVIENSRVADTPSVSSLGHCLTKIESAKENIANAPNIYYVGYNTHYTSKCKAKRKDNLQPEYLK